MSEDLEYNKRDTRQVSCPALSHDKYKLRYFKGQEQQQERGADKAHREEEGKCVLLNVTYQKEERRTMLAKANTAGL